MILSGQDAKVRLRHIRHLLLAISKCEVPLKSHVQRRYAEHATLFEETSSLLSSLGWIVDSTDQLELTRHGLAALPGLSDDAALRKTLTAALVTGRSALARSMARYLGQFRLRGDELLHRPILTDRILQSDLRNLMIDLGLVAHQPASDDFVITEEGRGVYVWALNYECHPNEHARDLARVGHEAELAALQFERDRLGAELSEKVVHVSAQNPFSSFDIESITLLSTVYEPRFIEVKAVSRDTFQFHWSAREVATAFALRSRYFLYLVPIESKGSIDPSGIWIIDNPLASVLANSRSWTVTPDSYVCSRKTSS